MACPQCKSENTVKNGFANNLQRYKCKVCGLQFSSILTQLQLNSNQIRGLLHLYIEGMGLREMSRLINLPHSTIYYHLKRNFKMKDIETLQNKNLVHPNKNELLDILKKKLLNENENTIIAIDYSTGSTSINSNIQPL